jgi:beta-lactamase regulating signal transducer with metallopeptidase domain
MTSILNSLSTIILTYSAHSVVACLVALACGRMLRRPQDRDLAWKAALVLPFVTSAAVLISSQAGASVMRVDLAKALRQSGVANMPPRHVMVRVWNDGFQQTVNRQLSDPVMTALSVATLVIAFLCVSIAIARLLARRRALARAIAGRQSSARMDGLTISVVDDLASPVALPRREICLPTIVVHDFSERHRATLIAHEMAHIERRDPHWFAFIELSAAVSAFQPLVRLVRKNFRRDVELICDESAVRRTSDASGLIGALAMLASPFDARSVLHGAPAAFDGSPLVARASRIATTSFDSPLGGRRLGLIAVAGVFIALVMLPVFAPAPRLEDFPADIRNVAGAKVMEHNVVIIRR